jgi:hypothetical protein
MPGSLKFVTEPEVVIRPIELFPAFVNHNAPSGPAVIPIGRLTPVPEYFVIAPETSILPIELFPAFVNHNAPSGPAVIERGARTPEDGKVVIVPVGAARAGVFEVSTDATNAADATSETGAMNLKTAPTTRHRDTVPPI